MEAVVTLVHTLVLNREAGSMFFLGEIYVDLALPVSAPISAHCGSCSACIDVCPTRAIVFGSLNDASSKVSQQHADPRRYDLLHEIGTRPRTAYLARVRNPNPELA